MVSVSYSYKEITFYSGVFMKRSLSSLFCILFFLAMLFFPESVFKGTQNGLLLWVRSILPSLFPFLIAAELLLHTKGLFYLIQVTSPILCSFFHVSPYGSFVVLTGFLCGYPLGAKLTAELLKKGQISLAEAQYLLSFTNNASPAFIMNYIAWNILGLPGQKYVLFFLLILSPILCSFLFRRKPVLDAAYCTHDCTLSVFAVSADRAEPSGLLNRCITESTQTILQIGGYVVLFSILCELLFLTGLQNHFTGTLAISLLEITNGAVLLWKNHSALRLICILSAISFGGVCSIFQVQDVLKGTPLKIRPYIIEKLVTALVTSLLAFFYTLVFPVTG